MVRESLKFKKTFILKAMDMPIRLHCLVASLVYPWPRDQGVHSTNQSSNLLKLNCSVFRYKRLPVLVRSLSAWRLLLFVQRRESFSNYESSCNQDEKNCWRYCQLKGNCCDFVTLTLPTKPKICVVSYKRVTVYIF